MNQEVLFALFLTLLAGLSTGIGSLMALFSSPNNKLLAGGMGLSAGVMIYISLAKLLPEANHSFLNLDSELLFGLSSGLFTTITFCLGMLLVYIINRFIPIYENPHSMANLDKSKRELLKTGILTAIILSIHNFPEGFVTYASAIKDVHLGLNVAFAIAIHNIPEGIAVAIPVYYATQSKSKAFWYSFLPGLSEPIGGVVAYLFLSNIFNELLFGIIFSVVAGIMIFISFDQLLPAAIKTKEYKATIFGLVLGIILMQLSMGFHLH